MRADLDAFWVHLDADVVDDALLPAVDYRMPVGLTWVELETALRTAVATGRMVGLDVTIFNPALDHDDEGARALARTIRAALAS